MDGMTERAMMDPEVLARSRLVRQYMRAEANNYRDRTTGEVSTAMLAAAAARDFDLYDGVDVTPAVLLEVAAEVAGSIN